MIVNEGILMISNEKILNKFYRDYKKLHSLIEIKTSLSQQDVAKIINVEIINAFFGSTEMKKYQKYLKEINISYIEKDNINYNDIKSEIRKVMNKYNWSIHNKTEDKITPDILGNVLEKYVNQRENGAYYTSNDTINFILQTSIYRYMHDVLLEGNADEFTNLAEIKSFFWKNIRTVSCEKLRNVIKEMKSMKIADISVGTGAFLVNSIDILFNINKELHKIAGMTFKGDDVLFNILENNIFGIDIMNDAVEICRFRIIIKSVQIMINENFQCKNIPPLNIVVANTLLIEKIDRIFNKSISFFDIIVGNPPYIEYSKIKQYSLNNYYTIKAGNVYAFMIEKSVELLREKGIMGLIVPISIVSTKRMKDLRKYLYDNSSFLGFANFSDRPGTLFNGVHQKLSIIFLEKDFIKSPMIKSTGYNHWYENERDSLFTSTNFYENKYVNENYIPKIGNQIEAEIINKLFQNKNCLLDLVNENGSQTLSLSMRLTFWTKCFIHNMTSAEYKTFHFETKKERDLFYLIINSDIFFFLWEVISDGWHITNKELKNITFIKERMNKLHDNKLSLLVEDLEKDLELNKEYIGSKQTEYVYKHKKSKIIIDKINKQIGYLFDLSEEEIIYLQNYNLKYRMNDELVNYQNCKEG